jgi:acylphosphatase
MHKHSTITLSGNLHHKGLKLRAMILASQFHIKGSVSESPNHITIEAEGTSENIDHFYKAIRKYSETDSMAKTIHLSESKPLAYYEEFIIK